MANAKGAHHCEEPATKQSQCHWETITELPSYDARNQKEVRLAAGNARSVQSGAIRG